MYKNWTDVVEDVLVVQGITRDGDRLSFDSVTEFYEKIPEVTDMKPFAKSKLFEIPAELDEHGIHGMCSYQPWITSGCSVYTWDELNRVSVMVHTCKDFDRDKAIDFIVDHFDMMDYRVGRVSYT